MGPTRLTPTPELAPRATIQERIVVRLLAEAWNAFLALDRDHPDELIEMRSAIHRGQDLIAFRVARRADPDLWR
jgi:hypothetical protein